MRPNDESEDLFTRTKKIAEENKIKMKDRSDAALALKGYKPEKDNNETCEKKELSALDKKVLEEIEEIKKRAHSK